MTYCSEGGLHTRTHAHFLSLMNIGLIYQVFLYVTSRSLIVEFVCMFSAQLASYQTKDLTFWNLLKLCLVIH